MLAGDLDPITPPRWGEEIAARLPRSFFVQFPATGHGSLPSHACAAAITDDFLDEPDDEPTTRCVDDLTPPAFTAADVRLELTPFEDDEQGLTGMRPESWFEAGPGVWQESYLTRLLQEVVPDVTVEEALETLRGTEAPLQPAGEVTTGTATWQLYSTVDLGQALEIAVADTPDGLVVV